MEKKINCDIFRDWEMYFSLYVNVEKLSECILIVNSRIMVIFSK